MSSRSAKPVRCRHSSSSVCSQCRRERQTLQQVGSWARGSSRNESNDYESFLRNNPDALSATYNPTLTTTMALRHQPTPTPTTKTKSSHSHSHTHTHNQPSSHHQSKPRHQPQSTHHQHPTQPSRTKTPTSSIAATRSTSPSLYRPSAGPTAGNGNNPAFNARQTPPASANASLVARDALRAMSPQTARRVGAHLALSQQHARRAEESESESESEGSGSESESGEESGDE